MQPEHADTRPHHPVVAAHRQERHADRQLLFADAIAAFAGQNRQAAFQQAKADHDFTEQELELKTNTELTRAVFYVCTDVKAHGHPARYSYSSSTGTKPGPMTPEQKAERKQVVANNKKWRSAETVRRKWLKEKLFGRKGAPKDGIRWVAQMLAEGSHPVRKAMESDHALAIELLGMPKQEVAVYHRRDKHVIAAAAENASPARATTLTVCCWSPRWRRAPARTPGAARRRRRRPTSPS